MHINRVKSYVDCAVHASNAYMIPSISTGPASSTCDRRQVATQSKTRSKKPSTLVQAAVRGTISGRTFIVDHTLHTHDMPAITISPALDKMRKGREK